MEHKKTVNFDIETLGFFRIAACSPHIAAAAVEENTMYLQLCLSAAFTMFSEPLILLIEYFSGAIIDSPAALKAAR